MPVGYRRRLMSAGRHSRGPSRSALRSLPALVLGLVAGTTAFVARDKHVTVSVDGQQRTVRTFAGTVGDLLDSQGLRVDLAHDMVSPSPSQRLTDGESVVVRYGRPVLLTVDGETRT